MPAAIGEITRLPRMLGGARQNHVEQRPWRECREQVGAQSADAIIDTIGAGVFCGRQRGVRIDVGSYHVLGGGARRREREDP